MVHHLNKPLSLPTQHALNDVVIQSELLQAKTIEFTCADDEGAESIRQYVTENLMSAASTSLGDTPGSDEHGPRF